jgi:hypothetical protein
VRSRPAKKLRPRNPVNYRTILRQMYEALYRQNVAVDFIVAQRSMFA